jgi:hypothetical protein
MIEMIEIFMIIFTIMCIFIPLVFGLLVAFNICYSDLDPMETLMSVTIIVVVVITIILVLFECAAYYDDPQIEPIDITIEKIHLLHTDWQQDIRLIEDTNGNFYTVKQQDTDYLRAGDNVTLWIESGRSDRRIVEITRRN